MNTRPYTRSVFGADTGIGAIDPPNLHLDMGPYAHSPINPHAFASGHQYGSAPGLRGLGAGQYYTGGPNQYFQRVHGGWPFVNQKLRARYATAAHTVSPYFSHARYGTAGLGQQILIQSQRTGRLGATMPTAYNTGAEPVPQLTQSFVYDPSGAPAVAITPTVPVIPAQTAVMPMGTQTLAVGISAPAPAHVSMGLVLAGIAAGVLLAVSVRHMVH